MMLEEKLQQNLEETKHLAERMHQQAVHIDELEKSRMADLQKVLQNK